MTSEAVCSKVFGVRSGAGTAKAAAAPTTKAEPDTKRLDRLRGARAQISDTAKRVQAQSNL